MRTTSAFSVLPTLSLMLAGGSHGELIRVVIGAPTPADNSAPAAPPAPLAAAGSWYKPSLDDTLLWSLSAIIPADPKGAHGQPLTQSIYGIDLFDVTAEQIAEYHSIGKKVSCYFSAGSWEPPSKDHSRPDAMDFDPACYCNKKDTCKMHGWDEWWFDLSSEYCINNVQAIMDRRLALAKEKGCDVVEPDNLDSYDPDNESSWPTTIDQQHNYLTFLANTAHAKGLGIALKNSPNMIAQRPDVVDLYDFVIIEECQEYDECGDYSPFPSKGKPAFDFEYNRAITCDLPGFSVASYNIVTSVTYDTLAESCTYGSPANGGSGAGEGNTDDTGNDEDGNDDGEEDDDEDGDDDDEDDDDDDDE